MKKVLLTFAGFLTGIILVQAQVPKLNTSTKSMSTYSNLMNKDMATVMKELKMTAKDTIGKTGTTTLQNQPGKKYTTLKVASGDQLAFYQNKLSAIIPKK